MSLFLALLDPYYLVGVLFCNVFMVTINTNNRWTPETGPRLRPIVRLPFDGRAIQHDELLAAGTGDDHLAETVGFEPTDPFRGHRFSGPATSTSRARFHVT